jgi:hypothetical protein
MSSRPSTIALVKTEIPGGAPQLRNGLVIGSCALKSRFEALEFGKSLVGLT